METKNNSQFQEVDLLNRLNPYTTPDRIPLEIKLGNETILGIPDEFHPKIEKRQCDGCTITEIIGELDGLKIHVENTIYIDSTVTEWVAYLTNNSSQKSPIISKFSIGNVLFEGKSPSIYLCSGDNGEMDSFQEKHESLDKSLVISPIGGRPGNGAWPYMRLLFSDYGINIAIGWPGQWEAGFSPRDKGVEFLACQQRMNMYLEPGEKIRSPKITFMGFKGDEIDGANKWRRWFIQHILIRENDNSIQPKCCMSNNGGGQDEFSSANECNQMTALNNLTNQGLKPDIWWIDAGWYSCKGNWRNTGTWKADSIRFPNGLAPIGSRCEELGIDLLLWFEPERVCAETEFAQDHPEWLLSRNEAIFQSDLQSITHPGIKRLFDSYLLNLADDDCCDYLIEYIDTLIKDIGIKIYRQDLNFNILPYWIHNEAPDRIGSLENHHVVNYLRYFDTLIERNPGLIIDSCASGGRRNDLETMRRAVPFHYTDVGYGVHPFKQMDSHVMFQWLPYFKGIPRNMDSAEGYYDETSVDKPRDRFAYHCAMAPMIDVHLDKTINNETLPMTKDMISIWKRVSAFMLTADYYSLSELRNSEEDYYAVQFHNPTTKSGYIQVIRNTRAKDNVYVVCPIIDDEIEYNIENSETKELVKLSGVEIKSGLELSIPIRSGVILFYWPIYKDISCD